MNQRSLKMYGILAFAFTVVNHSSWAGESVKWVGIVQEEEGYHSPKHDGDHDLQFIRQEDLKAFDVVESDDLVKLHAKKDKILLVEVEGEVTSRFLFWGGNLIVKNFKVLNELNEIQHRELVRSSASRSGFTGGGDRR